MSDTWVRAVDDGVNEVLCDEHGLIVRVLDYEAALKVAQSHDHARHGRSGS